MAKAFGCASHTSEGADARAPRLLMCRHATAVRHGEHVSPRLLSFYSTTRIALGMPILIPRPWKVVTESASQWSPGRRWLRESARVPSSRRSQRARNVAGRPRCFRGQRRAAPTTEGLGWQTARSGSALRPPLFAGCSPRSHHCPICWRRNRCLARRCLRNLVRGGSSDDLATSRPF
jgi:hypothetical protein